MRRRGAVERRDRERRLDRFGCVAAQGTDVVAHRADDPFLIQDGGEDEREAGEDAVAVAHVEQPVEDHVADAERRQDAGDERAGDRGDAAQIGERQQQQSDDGGEAVGRQLTAAVADQGAAEPGEE